MASLFAIIIAGCLGGTGVGTPSLVENRTQGPVCGKVLDSNGLPAAAGSVCLIPAAYRPASPYRAADTGGQIIQTSFAQGFYAFSGCDTGTYNLVAKGVDGWVALRESLRVSARTDSLPACSVRAPCAVSGSVVRRGAAQEGAFVYVAGLDVSALADTAGNFRLDGLPAGSFFFSVDLPGDTAPRVNAFFRLDSMAIYQTVGDSLNASFQPLPPVAVQPGDTAHLILSVE